MTSLDEILNEADTIIEKRAALESKEAVRLPEAVSMGDAEKFAHQIISGDAFIGPPKITEMTELEKFAHAVAIVETLVNLDQAKKAVAFEKAAASKGLGAQAARIVQEKVAWNTLAPAVDLSGLGVTKEAKGKLEKVLRWGTIPALALTGLVSHTKGKQKGYDQALADVNEAFKTYNETQSY